MGERVSPDVVLACDLDGTLLDEGGAAAPGIAEALRDLTAAGAHLVLCTGRPLHSAVRAAGELRTQPAAYVSYHGALVVDAASGEWLRHLTVPGELAARLVAAAHASGVRVTVYPGDERVELDPAASAAGLASISPGITRLVLSGDPVGVSKAMPSLAEASSAGLRIEPVRPGVIAVLPAGADKGDGLRLVVRHLRADPGRVIACGDAADDVALLRAATYGIAVGRAPRELARVARVVVARDELAAALRRAAAAVGA